MSDDDIESVTPETADDLNDYEIKLDGEWYCVVAETMAKDIPMPCPTCKEINNQSRLPLSNIVIGSQSHKILHAGITIPVIQIEKRANVAPMRQSMQDSRQEMTAR